MPGSRCGVSSLAFVAFVAFVAFARAADAGAASPAGAQGVPLVVNPPAGYPYPNVATSATPSAPAPAPSADPTSQSPNTDGAGGPPPRIDLSGEGPDRSPTMRVAGSLVPHSLVVSLRGLGRYRHDAVVVRARSGGRVAYAGVALQFVPGIATLVRPAPAGSAALLGLGAATIVVRGRDGARAAFRSSELIDADGDPRVFLVDRRSGLPLVAPEGPFRVVSPHDSTHARWIEDVVEIDVER